MGAAKSLGRTPCPECGDVAHVKQNEGKRPYRYCYECGANYATRNARQERDLLAKTRPEKLDTAPAPAPEPVAPPVAVAKPEVIAPAAKPGLFSSIFGGAL